MRPSLTPGGSRRSRLAASRMPPRQHTLARSSVCTATWTLLVQSQKRCEKKKALPSLRSDTRATAVQAHNTATLLPPEVVHGGWTCGETREVRQNGPVCREAVVRGPRCAVVRPPATFFRGVESYTVARLLLSTWVHCGAAGVPKPVRLHASSW